MKPNDPHHWTITLYGESEKGRAPHEVENMTGTIEEALRHADEMESGVDFEVHQFVITRGAPAPKSQE